MNILGITSVQGNTQSVHATIPKDAAKLLGISPGDKLIFIEGNIKGEVVVRINGANLLNKEGVKQ